MCANDLLQINPTMQTWVPHIMCMVVPVQILSLGDPARRSCDACESFGAMCKKIIKFATCRREISLSTTHTQGEGSWSQSFKKGWVQQTFERLCVRESLLHGFKNSRYLTREDHQALTRGRSTALKRRPKRVDAPTVRERLEAPTVPTELMERAYMA